MTEALYVTRQKMGVLLNHFGSNRAVINSLIHKHNPPKRPKTL